MAARSSVGSACSLREASRAFNAHCRAASAIEMIIEITFAQRAGECDTATARACEAVEQYLVWLT
jgi:hypothetical protein